MPCRDVERLFRTDPELRSILVDDDAHVTLVDRTRFLNAMSGPYGYGRSLYLRHGIGALQWSPAHVLPAGLDVVQATSAVLSRPAVQRFDDLVVDDHGTLRIVEVVAVLSELVQLHAHRADHDALTEMPNRAAVLRTIERLLDGTGRVALAFLDLDGFKRINDLLGHGVGDQLLESVGRRLRGAVRGGADAVGRLGGDEFVIVLDGAARDDARHTAERVLRRLREPFVLESGVIRVDASIGVALGRAGTVDASTLLNEADEAMYVAKSSRDHVVVVDHDLADGGDSVTRRQLEDAIDASDLVVHYQPIVPLCGSTTEVVEALVRWPRPDGSMRPPRDFIPVAETTGAVVDLDRWVLRTAARALARWETVSHAPRAVHVNLSARTLADVDVAAEVARILDEVGTDPGGLVIEITETAAVADLARAAVQLRSLRALGVRVSLDDFGVGHSSLAQLTRLPVSGVKIDRAFVTRLADSADDRTIVRLVLRLADELGLEVVAEGVETEQEAAELRALGCRLAQGWLYAPDLPEHALLEWQAGVPV